MEGGGSGDFTTTACEAWKFFIPSILIFLQFRLAKFSAFKSQQYDISTKLS